MEKTILKFEGKKPGKTAAIFAGVHGNERAGIIALEKFVKSAKIDSGILYCVFANPEAMKENVREINANLNRCFKRDIPKSTPEHERANELMNILDSCDALLDLHSSNSIDTMPFIICEENGLQAAKFFDFPIVSTGWGKVHPGGTDDYMNSNGKIGIALECGSTKFPEKNVAQAERAIRTFLSIFELQDDDLISNAQNQKRIDVSVCIKKETDEFSYTKERGDFELLPEGEVYASDGERKYIAEKNQVIIFPRPENPIGSEVGVIGNMYEN